MLQVDDGHTKSLPVMLFYCLDYSPSWWWRHDMKTRQITRYMGLTWAPQDPGGPYVGPMNLVIGAHSTLLDLTWNARRTQAMCSVEESPLNRIPAQPHPSCTAALRVAFVPAITQCFQILISYHTMNLSWFRSPTNFMWLKQHLQK